MNKTTKTTLSALVLALIATSAYAGIADTRHNLSAYNNSVQNARSTLKDAQSKDAYGNSATAYINAVTNSATDEICVFCHTPHAASKASMVDGSYVTAPLWNKKLPTGTTYTVYKSGTMDGTATLNSSSRSLASLACLSCHDGTQAMDNMINKPGSSGFTPGDGSSLGNMGAMSSSTIANLGTDLSDDHPVGVYYAGGNCSSTANGSKAGCKDQDFNRASQGTNGSWTVEPVGGAAKESQKLRLYGTALESATVECGSCHDPHTSDTATFLRISNKQSNLCLSCHAK